jgi:hypothetical protein
MNKILLNGLIFLLCVGLVGAVSAVVITESPSHVRNGEPITIDIKGLSDNADVSIVSEATCQVTPGKDFTFETTNFVLPISLDIGQISAKTNGVKKATFSAEKDGTEISVTRDADAHGEFSFSQFQSIPAGTFGYIRLVGTPLPHTRTVVSSFHLSGKKSGPDSSQITFAVDGVHQGVVLVSVFVNGRYILAKTITIDGDATPKSSLSVTSPNGGETWKRGTTQTISWDYTGSPGSSVKLVLLKDDRVVDTIANSVSAGHNGKGSFAWSIPSTGPTGNDYKVSIQSTSQPDVKDSSDHSFTLTPATSITVTSPYGGETWKRGTTQKITWDYMGSPGSTVKIVLLKGDRVVDTIASSVSLGRHGEGSYSWSIPTFGETGSDYKVSVQSVSHPDIKDSSDHSFTLVPTAAIKVTGPNGGETWKRGTTQTISWEYTGSPGSSVKIVLLKGDSVVETIANSVSAGHNGKGSYSWPISSSGPTGSDYKVSVQSTSQYSVKDSSDSSFTLTPSTSIRVTSPDGGESWRRGTTQKISWEYTGSPGSTVKIVLLKGDRVVNTIADRVSLGHNGRGSFMGYFPVHEDWQ